MFSEEYGLWQDQFVFLTSACNTFTEINSNYNSVYERLAKREHGTAYAYFYSQNINFRNSKLAWFFLSFKCFTIEAKL